MCRGDPADGSGCGGGGSVGGLGVVAPLLVDLLALLSLSGPFNDLLFIWVLRQLILSCVSLHLLRASRVLLDLLSCFNLLLMSQSLRCCSVNCL